MRSKLFRIYGALFAILIICLSLFWNQMLERMDIKPVSVKVDYKGYSTFDKKLKFELPSDWTYKEQKFEGGEIEYHVDLNSKDKKIWGLIQLWNIRIPLSQFLKGSKESGTGVVNYKYYKISEEKIGKLDGYFLNYSREGNDGLYYIGNEYFIPLLGNKFLRISFFAKEKDYKEDYRKLYYDIATRVLLN